jgi:hypothetical protein
MPQRTWAWFAVEAETSRAETAQYSRQTLSANPRFRI